jgi:hypothetical protein
MQERGFVGLTLSPHTTTVHLTCWRQIAQDAGPIPYSSTTRYPQDLQDRQVQVLVQTSLTSLCWLASQIILAQLTDPLYQKLQIDNRFHFLKQQMLNSMKPAIVYSLGI